MSQYPSPYYPPAAGQKFTVPQPPTSEAARRAAILGTVIGGLLLACGACVLWVASTQDVVRLMAEAGMQMPQAPPGMSVEELFRTAYGVIGIVAALIGVGMVTAAVFVGRGSRGAAITLIILNCVLLLVLLLQLAGAAMQAVAGNGAAAALTGILVLVPTALVALDVTWLGVVVRESAARRAYAAAMRQQFEDQYARSRQLERSYQPGGIGYATASSSSPPPSPQSSDNVRGK